MDIRIRLRIIFWLALALVLGFLLYQGIVPTGRITYAYDFSKPNYFINKLSPLDRVLPVSSRQQSVVGDPAYFSLRTPRPFSKAKMTVVFKNPDNLPIIEAGVLSDKKLWRYQTKPLQNMKLDELPSDWNKIESEGLSLYQLGKKYSTVASFLQNPPSRSQLALYNTQLANNFRLPDYQAATSAVEIKLPIRGAFQMNVYLKNEKARFDLKIEDLNLNKDKDVVTVELWQGNALIASSSLGDDGVSGDIGTVLPSRKLELLSKVLPEGVYRLEVVANDDIVTQKITTTAHSFSFVNKLWLAGEGNEANALWTDSQAVNLQTINPAKLKTVMIGGRSLKLAETYKQYTESTDGNLTKIYLPMNDVIISGDGVFAL
ncbi:hypothetical protein HGA64_05460, partial [Candidatus Falkowbacteria bacterium]|nr:hypothetical protein [Candidatus Falkowbacteria bacterium]